MATTSTNLAGAGTGAGAGAGATASTENTPNNNTAANTCANVVKYLVMRDAGEAVEVARIRKSAEYVALPFEFNDVFHAWDHDIRFELETYAERGWRVAFNELASRVANPTVFTAPHRAWARKLTGYDPMYFINSVLGAAIAFDRCDIVRDMVLYGAQVPPAAKKLRHADGRPRAGMTALIATLVVDESA